MVNVTLWWLFLIPMLLSLVSITLLPKLSNGAVSLKLALIFAGIGLIISMGIMSAAFYAGKGSKTADTEVWNGRITAKEREHDTYEESYQCRCRPSCSGSGKNRTCGQVCDTCYRTHYTVTWTAKSTIGGYRIDHLDSLSRSVYREPDPAFYSQIKVGEACSKVRSYTNYIKAVPESLFHPLSAQAKAQFASMIPAYPINVYNFWHVDRVIPVKVNVPNLREWNDALADSLKDLGNSKQVNAVIVLVNHIDPTYAYALKDAWLNGKKNDVVLIIGTTNFPNKAEWVDVLALTDHKDFIVKLQNDIAELETLTAESVIGALKVNIVKHFKRKSMKDFSYLDAEIDPPMWVNVTTALAILLAYIGFWIFTYRNRYRNFRFTR